MRLRLIAALLMMLCSMPSWATTFYTSKLGSDSNSCTTAQSPGTDAKLTIGGGIGCLTAGAGDTLIIQNGTYAENISGIPSGSTSYANATTIRAQNSRLAIVQPTSGVGIQIYPNASVPQEYIVIDGLVVDMTDSTVTRAVEMVAIPDDPLEPSHIRMNDVELRNGMQHGMAWFSGRNLEFLNGSIHDMHLVGYVPGGVGIYWNADDCILENSSIYNLTNTGGNPVVAVSIFTSSGMTPDNARVDSVRIFDIGDASSVGLGINFSLATDPIVINTRIYRITGGGISAASSTPAVDNAQLDNNSIFDVDGTAIAFEDSTNNFVRNNILFGNGGTITGTGYTASNNLTTNPDYVDSANGDFHLLAGSSAIDAGTTLAHVTDDADGVARPQGAAYDIGAYEFVGGTVPQAPGGTRVVIRMRNIAWLALTNLLEGMTMLHTLLGLLACVPFALGLWKARGRIIWYGKRAYLIMLRGLLRLGRTEPDTLTVDGALEEAEAILRDETLHTRT